VNAVAGACLAANNYGAALPPHRLQTHAIDDTDGFSTLAGRAPWQRGQAQGYFSGPGWAPNWHDDGLQVQAYAEE
jgi:hypothetical protein